jgi:acetoin utilization deacetylase AcuC-like enzyme
MKDRTPRVGLYDHPLFRAHDAGPGHPERPERLAALRAELGRSGLEERLHVRSPRPATDVELCRVHTEAHVRRISESDGRWVRFDADTQAGPSSHAAARHAAGAVIEAVDAVLDGNLDRAFCAVRPPGHHAGAGRAMGFCLFNNVAVGAAHALARGLHRVQIVDFDVHHGNGTQEIFEAEPRVLYVSSHAFPHYPGTGGLDEQGEGAGEGFTVNLPLPQGCGDGEYVRAYREVVAPIGRAFDPELVLVSAGFDAHLDDPLAGMSLSEAGFAALTDVCLEVAGGAAHGRAVFVLEGGYDLGGLSRSAAGTVSRMLGHTYPVDIPRPAPGFNAVIARFRTALRERWTVLG